MSVGVGSVEQVGRAAMAAWLPKLDEWLLTGAFYGVQHTWPQLYRSDGQGMFFVVRDGDRLLSHCACRVVTVHGEGGPFQACLLGSVATEPTMRGQGLAGQVIGAALDATAGLVDHTLLWAERPELYARHGFVWGASEACLQMMRRPKTLLANVRQCDVQDHATLCELHAQKPWRVERSFRVMSGLLTTPGMTTVVLERNGVVVAYACCGKGADLQGHWHEVGGRDEDLALLLPAAMHVAGQVEAFLLLPPYRAQLRRLLLRNVVGELAVAGPMARSPRGPLPAIWIDGLDSV